MNSITSESVSELTASDQQETASTAAESSVPSTPSLPDKPLFIIEPSKSWVALNLGDLWTYRELLYFLTWRDIKVRYKQTVMGAAWAIIQPFCTMLIFTLFFGKLAGIPSDGVPYPIFAYAGLLPWTFFSNSVTNSGNSLVGSSNLITKIYFPRMMIPGAAVLAGLVDLAVASALLVGLMIFYGVTVSSNILVLPLLVLLITLLAVGVGLWMSALNVKYRDIRYALPFLIQVWMFLSPVIYPLSMVTGKWRWALMLNPITGIIEGFRAALFGSAFNWAAIALSAGITLAIVISSAFAFRRMEKDFADVI